MKMETKIKKRMIVLATAFALSFAAALYGMASAPSAGISNPGATSNVALEKNHLEKNHLGFGAI